MSPIDEPREWEEWQGSFRAAGSAPAVHRLRRLAARHRRWLLVLAVGEWLLAVAAVAGPAAWLAAAPQPWKWAWALTLWAFLAVALGFAAWNRRGTWQPAGDSVAAHLDLVELRCRRQLRTLRYLPAFMLAEAAAVLALVRRFAGGSLTLAGAVLVAVFAGVALWAVWFYLHTRRTREQVAALRRELAG